MPESLLLTGTNNPPTLHASPSKNGHSGKNLVALRHVVLLEDSVIADFDQDNNTGSQLWNIILRSSLKYIIIYNNLAFVVIIYTTILKNFLPLKDMLVFWIDFP